MLTSSAFLLPSVPTMLIDEQRGDVTEMIEALEAAGARNAGESPAAIVVVSPRWVSVGPFHADDSERLRSVVDVPGFGVEPRYDCAGSPALARAIVEHAVRRGLRAATAHRGVDTAASVPLHFFTRGRRVPVVPVSVGEGGVQDHRAWGAAVRFALDAWHERVTFVAAGALSWHLHAFNLRREVPECGELDARVLTALEHGNWDELEPLVSRLGERAHPEASLRHLEVMRGFLGTGAAAGHVIEREQLPGIGTALVEFPLDADGGGAGG
jgi:aromatic ring-opening dioxygenase catalytic subunit (LigB family)